LDHLHAALKRHVEPGLLPGLVALVHHRGREHVETIGTMGFDSKSRCSETRFFGWASMTKPVTAVAP
jgi:CubicO group peptidase (beta-lactamase class C family)